MTNRDYQDIEAVATEMAGNWREFGSFGWYDQPEDSEKWTIVYTHNRDSRLLEMSNAETIAKLMQPYCNGKGALNEDDPDCRQESHGHWAVGHVDGFAIRVFNAKGEITLAFKEWVSIQCSLSDYPVLDDEDYSRREYEATHDNIRDIGYRWVAVDVEEGWEADVYEWLSENYPSALESRDDQGGYPNEALVKEALEDLGYAEESEDE